MTKEEKQKAVDALKISAPVSVVTQEEFNDYIQTLNHVMDWLEQEPRDVFDEYGNYKYPSGVELTEPNTATSMPCDNAISRQAVLDQAMDYGSNTYLVPVNSIKALPPVKPQQKIGHWIWQTEDIYRCSECGNDIRVKEVMNIPQYVRCPMCEAKMVEPQERSE